MKRILRILFALGCLAAVLAVALAIAFYRDPLSFSDEAIRFHLRRQHVHSEYIQVDGYNLHYLEALPPIGKPSTPLVLIHGLGSRGEDWSGMIPSLAAAGFHVYAPDLLGYGRSPRPDADYSISLEEKIVTDFMQATGIPHAAIGGWSMGGWVALKFTIDHPSLVDRLIVYDAAGIYFPATYDASLFVPTTPAGVEGLLAMLSPHPKTMQPFIARAVIRRLGVNGWVIERSVNSMRGGRDLLDFQLHRIHKPTLVVWGKEDTLIPLSVGERIHDGISGSSLFVVAGCGHLAPSECAPPIVQETIAFLRATPPAVPFETEVPDPEKH